MSFISWQYACLLLGVFLLYWQMPWRGRIWLLLLASYVFYGFWDVRFLALLLTSTTIDFFCGLAIGGQRQPLGRVALTAFLPLAWLCLCRAALEKALVLDRWILIAAALFPLLFCGLYLLLWRLSEPRQRRAFLLLSVLTNLGVLGFLK
jgi:alginate O-acetyltransferase complex protein AlgI